MKLIYKNILFFIVVAASAWYLNSNLLIVSNIEQFMPNNVQDKNVKILIDRSQKGPFANLVLVQISESNDENLSRLSQILKSTLEKKTGIFDSVINSSKPIEFKDDVLLKYRYLLHDNNFDVDSLRHSFEQFLTAFTTNAPSEFIDYLLTDPQKVFLNYLSLNQVKAIAKDKKGVWFINDKSLLMVQIQEKADIVQKDLAIATIQKVFAASSPGSAQLLLSGPSVVAAETRANIKNTIQYVSLALAMLMLFIFVFVYRSSYLLLLAVITLSTSILIAMTLTQIIFGQIHGIVLAFGITALGVCLDYPLHVFSNTSATTSAAKAVKNISTPLKIGALTSVFAYISLMGTGFDGLTQLAIFAIIGLLSALFVSIYFIPLWMQEKKINKKNVSVGKLLPLTPKILISLLVVLLPATFLLQQDSLFDTNISQLNPASAESKQLDADLRQALGVGEVNHIFLTSDEELDAVLKKTQTVQRDLKNLIEKRIIKGAIGVDTLLPSKDIQKYRLANLPSKQTLQDNISLAIEGLPFKKNAFDVFADEVDFSKTMTLLNYQNFKESMLEEKLQSLLFFQNNTWYSLIRVVDIKDIELFNKQVNSSSILRDSYYSISTEAGSIMNDYLKETWARLLIMLLLLFLATLWFSYAHKKRIWIIIPVFSGVLISLSFQILLGNSINIFHLLSLLLVVGLGFDYSLFFNHENKKINEVSNSAHAIIISATTTIITFSILAFSNVSILSSIGQIVVVGVVACFIISKFISTPTLTTMSKP
ncbi:MMPL family transporter [Candidatus Thioglobus sp.]|uniref:MMPL family transporter n=1 Tax=Candidatus Thioglobus sp. TaxID=2026721 RepID=UPI003D142515